MGVILQAYVLLAGFLSLVYAQNMLVGACWGEQIYSIIS